MLVYACTGNTDHGSASPGVASIHADDVDTSGCSTANVISSYTTAHFLPRGGSSSDIPTATSKPPCANTERHGAPGDSIKTSATGEIRGARPSIPIHRSDTTRANPAYARILYMATP